MATAKPKTHASAGNPKVAGGKKPAKAAASARPKGKVAAKSPQKRDTGKVLLELKSLARELNQAAKGLTRKSSSNNPKEVSIILGNVERMTAEAATRSLEEAEHAKRVLASLLDSLGKDWSRHSIESSLRELTGHLTNIIVAQEFQDLAGQSLRVSIKALVGSIIVVEANGPTEDRRLSQLQVDSLLNDLMP